jgi:hypothetical protein
MCPRPRRPIMFAMTHPLKTSKVLLVEDRRGGAAQAAAGPVRRYRLARLRLNPPAAGREPGFEYLKRLYD